jgi:hypothetical protein
MAEQSYLAQLKSILSPEQYDALTKPLMYSANEVYGGQVQDYQAQLLTPINIKKFGLPQELEMAPAHKEWRSGGWSEPDYQVDVPAQAITKGLRAITYDNDSGGGITGYVSEKPIDVNGVPVYANYDAQGKLTGYDGDPAYTSWINGKQRLIGKWDANGMPTPTTNTAGGAGFRGLVNDVTDDPIMGALANIAASYFGGPLGVAALGAVQGRSPEDIAKNAALSYVAGQVAPGVTEYTGNQAVGQFAGNTTAGLLSGQDLGSSLTNAAINTGANQAASGLMNAANAPATETYKLPTDFSTGANYSLTGNTGGLGLQATPAPLDMSNPYSFDNNYTATGGLGFNASLAPYNASNPYSLETNYGNLGSMGGGTGLQIPNQEGATLGSIGAAAETPSDNPNLVNSSGTGLLSGLLKSLFTGSSTGSTGTGNMATQDNNAALSNLLGGLLGGAGSLMQGSTNNAARQTMANAQIAAGQQAAQASQFRPVGTTTTFGTSNFQVDPTTGQLTSAGYNLSPQLQAYQNQIMGGGQQSLTDAANLQNLGRGYIAQSPEAAAQQYMTAQQALLAPSRDMESARLANQLQQTGRTGVSVAQGGNLGMANPEQQALANARAIQDLNLAAQAQQQGRAQTTFGQGLLTGAYDPFNAGLKTSATVEGLGQQPYGMSADLASQFQKANAQGAGYNLNARNAAANTMFPANQYNPTASVLSGAGGNTQLTGALGGLLGSTGIGSSIGKYLGGLAGSNLNNAASDYISQNPDIIPPSTFNGSGDASWMNEWWMGGSQLPEFNADLSGYGQIDPTAYGANY